jgi:hypothetical membrane protein
MDPRLRRAGTWLGVLGVAAFVLGTTVAVVLAPWFSPTANALSDLGARGQASAPAFNLGLIAAGVLGVGFAARLWPEAPGTVSRAGVALLGLALVSLALVGVFPVPHSYHVPAAIGFFVSLTYALFVYGTGQVLAGRARSGLVTVWLGIAHVTGWLGWALAGARGLAIPESMGAMILGVWVVRTTQRLRG